MFNNFYWQLEASYWQMGFQDPATPMAARIIEMHHHVFFFLVLVLIFVSWMLYSVVYSFWFIIPENFNSIKSVEEKTKILKTYKLLTKLRFYHNTTIEVIWTTIPSLILIAMAMPSFGLLYAMDDMIDPELTLKVMGHQWYWSYEYSDLADEFMDTDLIFDSYMLPEDELELGQLRLLEVDNPVVLPLGAYVRVNVTAADVLHSWAMPSLGIKIDAVPNSINSGMIFLQRKGVFYGQCSEICGVNHGFMPIAIKSVDPDTFWNWAVNNSLQLLEDKYCIEAVLSLLSAGDKEWLEHMVELSEKEGMDAWSYKF